MADPLGTVAIIGGGSRAKDLATLCLAAGWLVRTSLDDAGAAAGAQVAIELVGGDPDQEDRLFRELDAVAGAEAILATASVWPSAEARARVTRRPERVVGLHFVGERPATTLVEVAVTPRTSQAAVGTVVAFLATLGRTAVPCADAPGFVVARVGRGYRLEALRMLEAGQGSVAGIDLALEAAGHARGPFKDLDDIGLDAELAMGTAMFEAFDEAPRFRPPDLLRVLVDGGRLGRTSGLGLYRYAPDGSAQPDVAPGTGQHLPPDEIVERIELAVINEAYRAVEERVAAPVDVDLAMRLGAGYPLGPFERVAELGLRRVVERLRALHAITGEGSGDQYAIAPLLWRLATA